MELNATYELNSNQDLLPTIRSPTEEPLAHRFGSTLDQ